MHDNTTQINSIRDSKVLVRVSYDLSFKESTFRVYNSIPTITKLLKQNNTVILLTHWGRPKGKEERFSLQHLLEAISNVFYEHDILTNKKLHFIDQYETGLEETAEIISKNRNSVFLLENTRFDDRERSEIEDQKIQMAQEYAQLADYFVDESFPISHRSHATNAYLKQALPSTFGISYSNEVEELSAISKNPQEPLIVISGGAKLETKIPVLEKLAYKADKLLIGGLICFTLLKAKGITIEGAPIDENLIPYAESLLNTYEDKLIFPTDFVYGDDEDGSHPYDIGPHSIELFSQHIATARSIFWNGPLGFYENGYTEGTKAIASKVIENTKCYSVIGGGDITASLPIEILDKFDFVSAGGGATLEFLAKGS